MVDRWLTQQGLDDAPGCLTVVMSETGTEHLAVGLPTVWLELEPVVQRAEESVPLLGWTLVTAFDQLSLHCSVDTPWKVRFAGECYCWSGCATDEEFINEHELAGGDDNPLDLFKPSDYDASFNDSRVLDSQRPRLTRQQLRQVRDKHADAWIARLAGLILDALRLDESRDEPVLPEGASNSEPIVVCRWNREDSMDLVIDEYVARHWEDGDSLPFEMFLPFDTSEERAAAIEVAEHGFRRLKCLYALVDHIMSSEGSV